MDTTTSPVSPTPPFLRDPQGFSGAEKALLICAGLAIITLTGYLVSGGSRQAATDARTALFEQGKTSPQWQRAVNPMSAGEVQHPSMLGKTGLDPDDPGFRKGAGGPASGTPNLVYRGGPVIANVKIVTVFWENGKNTVNQTVKDKIGGFYKAAVDSPYMDWLSEYDTHIKGSDGSPGTDQHIGRGTYGGDVTIHPTSGDSITNKDIQAEINRQIDAGNLPKPDANTLYMIHFPPAVQIDLDGSKSCQEFCAYHNTMQRDGKNVYYGVMPDVGAGSACASGCGGDSDSFNNQTSVASHEMIEAVTDPAVGLATGSGPPLGWYDDKNGEIGDICNAQQGKIPGTDYTVQKEWSNTAGGCVVVGSGVAKGGKGKPKKPPTGQDTVATATVGPMP